MTVNNTFQTKEDYRVAQSAVMTYRGQYLKQGYDQKQSYALAVSRFRSEFFPTFSDVEIKREMAQARCKFYPRPSRNAPKDYAPRKKVMGFREKYTEYCTLYPNDIPSDKAIVFFLGVGKNAAGNIRRELTESGWDFTASDKGFTAKRPKPKVVAPIVAPSNGAVGQKMYTETEVKALMQNLSGELIDKLIGGKK